MMVELILTAVVALVVFVAGMGTGLFLISLVQGTISDYLDQERALREEELLKYQEEVANGCKDMVHKASEDAIRIYEEALTAAENGQPLPQTKELN